VPLSLFLIMALMSMQLLGLVAIAGPLLIPIVGAFFADIANALVLQAFLALPMMGF